MWRILLLVFCANICIESVPSPRYAQLAGGSTGRCKQDDKACIKKMSAKMFKESVIGNPSLNISSLMPLYQKNIAGNLATIKYRIWNATMIGFEKCKMLNSELYLKSNKYRLELLCPFIDIFGNYEINGEILGVRIEGDGDFYIQAKDYYVDADANIEVKQKDGGSSYMAIKTYKLFGESRGGLHLDLRNLFHGNKELGDSVLKFLNENSKAVGDQLQGPVLGANVKVLVKNFNKYFKANALDSLIILD